MAFPPSPEQPCAEPEPDSGSTVAAAVGNEDAVLRTFIVEDSAVILENLSETLEETSPVSVVGSAADEGCAMRGLAPPVVVDLVIIDLFLKSGSGLGVLRKLRDSGSTTHRIVLTNYASEEIRQTCMELGANQVFDKSTDLEALINYCIGLGSDLQAVAHRG